MTQTARFRATPLVEQVRLLKVAVTRRRRGHLLRQMASRADALEARLTTLEARIARVEGQIPSWEWRIKTLERNHPLEVRLRNLERAAAGASAPPQAGVFATLVVWLLALSKRARGGKKRGSVADAAPPSLLSSLATGMLCVFVFEFKQHIL